MIRYLFKGFCSNPASTAYMTIWISSFIHGRTQQVLVEGCTSEKLDVLSGVPQGTVVGPLLFLIYINDLPTVCKSSKANLFADNTLLYRHIANDGDSTKLQEDLTALEDWESKWQMSFHPEKCTVLRITTNKRYHMETNYRIFSRVRAYKSQTAPNTLE